MGSSHWSDDAYSHRVNTKVKDAGTAFVYDKAIKDGHAPAKVAASLDPKGLKVRESRDSDAHPNSNAIFVALDVTGSMGTVVGEIHSKLPTLMGLLTRKNYIPDPQILFSAVGDAFTDRSPCQVGQFESGAEMESDLGHFHVEGGGGGTKSESYELMAYVGARKTSIDCHEKRGRKGYFFFIGDELPYNVVSKNQLSNIIGEGAEADIPVAEIMEELKAKYNVFFILPTGANHGHDPEITKRWKELLGPEQVLTLEIPSAAAELIATQIGLCEGSTDIDAASADLKDSGASEALVKVVKNSLSKHYAGGTISKVAPGVMAASSKDSDVKRL